MRKILKLYCLTVRTVNVSSLPGLVSPLIHLQYIAVCSSVATGGTGGMCPPRPQSGQVMGISKIRGENFCVAGERGGGWGCCQTNLTKHYGE